MFLKMGHNFTFTQTVNSTVFYIIVLSVIGPIPVVSIFTYVSWHMPLSRDLQIKSMQIEPVDSAMRYQATLDAIS